MNWFKKLFCDCEVDMKNLDAPVCLKCGSEIPRLLNDSTPFSLRVYRHYYNPKLEKWRNRHIAMKTFKLFQGKK